MAQRFSTELTIRFGNDQIRIQPSERSDTDTENEY